MPGLFGMVRLTPDPLDPIASRRLLDEMADRLQHDVLGGPGLERLETWADWESGFAIARIGLDDLPRPAWPEASIRGRWFFGDGLFHDDAPAPEDLLREADPSDAELARRLEGFWAAVTYRPGGRDEPRRVALMVDRRSQRQMVWAVRDGILYFAPEVKALLAVDGVGRRLDPGALGMFFASGFLLADHTFFDDVRRLEGGTLLAAGSDTGNAPRIERYADYRFTVDGDGTPYEDVRSELGRVIERAVRRNVAGDIGDLDREVVFLSGGKDSRMILASAVRAAGDPSKVRAVSWTSNDPQPGSDVHLARQIAEHMGVRYDELRRTQEGFDEKALRLSWMLDGLTDVGTFHGDELRIMEDLRAMGIRKVLRGDQCFTRGRAMPDPTYAILRMCLRSTSQLGDGAFAWRPSAHVDVCEAGDAWLDAVRREYADAQPDNAGDEVYFRHRLQGYLNSAVYFKHVVLDHRNPLLDEGLMRLIQRLSIAARNEQKILNEGGSEAFPEIWNAFPFASRSNLEDYGDLLARDTPVRRAVGRALADADSALWEWLDRESLSARFQSLSASGKGPGLGSRLKKWVKGKAKTVVSKAVYDLPSVDTRIRRVYLAKETRMDEVFLRVLSLKHTVDLLVTGGGRRAAYDAMRARLREEAGDA
ncbi:MAG: asparagine synthase-related protein [Acidobacteriota bacterium]